MNDQSTSAVVVVMQRLHETDLTGVLLARSLGFVHLMIPMEYEPERQCTTPIGWSDPRTYDGELMDPVRMPRAAVERLKAGSLHSWSGQYQQRPAAREGAIFKRAWFPIVEAVPNYLVRVRAWDLASTQKKSGNDPDWTVGLRMARDVDGYFYIEQVERFRESASFVERTVKSLADTDPAGTTVRLPQDPGQAGKAQAETYVRLLAGYDIVVQTVTGEKETRAKAGGGSGRGGQRPAWSKATGTRPSSTSCAAFPPRGMTTRSTPSRTP